MASTNLLDKLPAYKVRPADDKPPHKFQTGTQSHENQAGFIGVMEYLQWFSQMSSWRIDEWRICAAKRAEQIHAAMQTSQDYEQELCAYLIKNILQIKGVQFFGIQEPERASQRVPTIAIRIAGRTPEDIAQHLASQGICVWNGNYYALNLTERLGVEESGGMVRIGLSHYSTRQEVDRLLEALS